MIKCILLLFSIIVSLSFVKQKEKNLEGLIITEVDTTSVIFVVPYDFKKNIPSKLERIPFSISYFKQGEKFLLNANEALEINFKDQGILYRYAGIKPAVTNLDRDPVTGFYHYKVRGYLNLFYAVSYTASHENGGGKYGLVQIKGSKYFRALLWDKKGEGIKEYFQNSPKMIALIEEGRFKRKNEIEMIEYYNEHFAPK